MERCKNSVSRQATTETTIHIGHHGQAFEVGGQSCRCCFSWFSTIFPRSEAKNGISVAAVEVEDSPLRKSKEGRLHRHHATGPVLQPTCDTVSRAIPPLSTEGHPPKAGGGTSARTVPRWIRILQELRRPARRVHAERPDNRVLQR